MSPEIVGFIGIMLMFILMVMRIWVGVAMALVGFGLCIFRRLGHGVTYDWYGAIQPDCQLFTRCSSIVLFMGALSVTGISQDLYIAARKWIGRS